ncbi:MAG: Gfo/Idh/MocA family oxidoreductase [Actinomycetota bacterium]
MAVVGTGRWGLNIVRDLVTIGSRVIAVDPDEDARRAAADLGAAQVLSSLDLVDLVDGFVVATPASTHAQIVDQVAQHSDVPIACEKPLTVSADEAALLAHRLVDRLTVLHVWRYHPGVELMAEMARTGRLGEVDAVRTTRANWTSPRTDIDPVWTLLPHDLSIAVEFFDAVPSLVCANVEYLDRRAVGAMAMFQDRTSRARLIAEVSTRFTDRRREIRVHGSEGVATMDADDPAGVVRVAFGRDSTPHLEEIAYERTPALERQLGVFCRYLTGGPAPKTTGSEGAAVVEAVEHVLTRARDEAAPDES